MTILHSTWNSQQLKTCFRVNSKIVMLFHWSQKAALIGESYSRIFGAWLLSAATLATISALLNIIYCSCQVTAKLKATINNNPAKKFLFIVLSSCTLMDKWYTFLCKKKFQQPKSVQIPPPKKISNYFFTNLNKTLCSEGPRVYWILMIWLSRDVNEVLQI